MSSQSVPAPAQASKQNRVKPSVHGMPLRAAFIAFVAIVILFRWLHLIVSLQVASTDRQIQISTDELAKIERSNAALLYSISEAMSPRSLAQRAEEIGYCPQTPAYVTSDEPLLPEAESAEGVPQADKVLSDLVTPAAAMPGLDLASNQAQAAP